MHSSNHPFLNATLMVLLCVRAVSAGTLLDLTFDDPHGLLKSKPEGITRITPEVAGSAATIASGTGGRALPQIAEGPLSERQGKPDDARLQVLAQPPFGSKSFFRASLEANSATRNAGLGIIPESPATSLNALTRIEDQYTRIEGAFDFFFRMTAGSGSPKLVLMAKVAQMGLVLSAIPASHQLTFKVFTGSKSLDIDGDKTGDKAAIEKLAEGGVDSDVIYHAAIVFRTAGNGSITVDFCLEPGVGSLDPSNSVVASIDGFWLLAESQKGGVEKIVINVGRNETSQQTLDIAALRISSPVPKAFPGLDGGSP